jgi:hypothetical protein
LEEQRRLRLRAGQAELAGVARKAPSGVIRPHGFETLGDIDLVRPFDLVLFAAAMSPADYSRFSTNPFSRDTRSATLVAFISRCIKNGRTHSQSQT